MNAVPVAADAGWQRVPLTLTHAGAVVRGAACVRRVVERSTRAGKPYLDVDVGHREGTATLRVWSDTLPAWGGVRDGTAVELTLECRPGWRQGTLEWTPVDVRRLPSDHPVRADLLPRCPVPLSELEARWDALVAQLSPEAEVLLHAVLDHVGEDAYRRAPAAERMHHAVSPLGLLWHSLEVAEGALALAGAYAGVSPPLDTDVIILGGLLHDVGKIIEYEVEPGVGIKKSTTGWARYHTTLGAELIAVACALGAFRLREAGVPRTLIAHIKHIVESHHGDIRDHGSPTPPRSREGWLIHAADLASARVRAMTDDALAAGPADADGWHLSRDGRRTPVLCRPASTAGTSGSPRTRPLEAMARGEGATLVLLPEEGA